MPIYSYHCPNCYKDFEKMVPTVADGDKIPACPNCDGVECRKSITAPSLHMRYSPMHPRYMRGQRT